MHTLHEHVVGAQDRLATLVRATVDDHILADDVHVAHDDLRVGTLEIEILRQGSDDGAWWILLPLPMRVPLRIDTKGR